MSSENNFFIKISMNITLKYVVVSVAAKMSAKFGRSTDEISKNRSKFKKDAIIDLFGLSVHKRFSAV